MNIALDPGDIKNNSTVKNHNKQLIVLKSDSELLLHGTDIVLNVTSFRLLNYQLDVYNNPILNNDYYMGYLHHL